MNISSAHIIANHVRSIILFAMLFVIMYLLAFGGCFLWEMARDLLATRTALTMETFDAGRYAQTAVVTFRKIFPAVSAVALVWIAFSVVLNGVLFGAVSGARTAAAQTYPRLHRIFSSLCARNRIEAPSLAVIDDDSMNAFASGLFKSQYCVTVTTGLLERLDDAELEFVLGHELAHIQNRDVRIGTIAFAITGGIALILHYLVLAIVRGICLLFGVDDEDAAATMIITALLGSVFLALAWFITTLVCLALSRQREYLADAGAVALTGNAAAGVAALTKVCDDSEIGAPAGVMQLCLDNPRRGLMELFSTHPEPEDRIAALASLVRVAPAPRRAAQRGNVAATGRGGMATAQVGFGRRR